MAQSNAERQAKFRSRVSSERVTETELRQMLFAAYTAGRMDVHDRVSARDHDGVYRVACEWMATVFMSDNGQ